MIFRWSRLPLFLVLLPGVPIASLAQVLPPPFDPFASMGRIDSIMVTGNEKTKDYVILDEMALRAGMEATAQMMEYDRNRIYSLGLFNHVAMTIDSSGGPRVLRVEVSERWYLIPLPVFGFAEGDIKKPYFGGGVIHNNFQGRNQKILALATFGYNPSLQLSFSDPLISRKANLSFSTNLSYARIENKSEIESSLTGDFNEHHYNINATLGKRLSLFENLTFTLGYQVVDVAQYSPGRTVSSDGVDRFFSGTIAFFFDSRDLREYASMGSYAFVGVSKLGFGEAAVNFSRFNLDLRHYIPLPASFTLAGRAHGAIVSGGEVPTYAHAYFGYAEKIRGYYNDVLEGENMVGGSVELRYELLEPQIIHFSLISLPPEFSVWRFGIGLALFADTGTIWFRGDPVQWTDFYSGYGGGIHFLLPYSIVIRTEYAWNEMMDGQFIFALESSF